MRRIFVAAAVCAAVGLGFGAETPKAERRTDAEGKRLCKEHLRECAKIADDREWLGKVDIDWACRCFTDWRSELEGRTLAIECVVDRIYAHDPADKFWRDAQERHFHAFVQLVNESNSGELRRRLVTMYAKTGRRFEEAQARYQWGLDLEGARRIFTELAPKDERARRWLEYLADKPDMRPQLAVAAREFTNWVTKISGKAPDMTKVVMGTPEYTPEIAAFARRHADDFAKLADNDGFIIAEEDGRTYLAAGRTKGVLNAVYRYLEKNSDIIFVRPLEADEEGGCGTIYTKDPAFKNTVKYLVDIPTIKLNRSFGLNSTWGPRNGLGEIFGDSEFRNQLGAFFNARDWLDVTTRRIQFMLCVDSYKASDPDIFPLVDGKRDLTIFDHQLCFMNPKTWELVAKEVVVRLKSMPKNTTWYGLGLGDNWRLCECPLCTKEIDCGNGRVVRPTDKNFRSTQFAIYVNEVSKRVTAACPWVGPTETGAYIFTAQAPGVPVPGGVGYYCPYVKNHKKPVYDDSVNEAWHRRAEDVFAAGLTFRGLYEYYLCNTTPHFYHAIAEVAQKDLLYYLKHGVKEYHLDTSTDDGYWQPGKPRMGMESFNASAVEYWVMTRLLWHPERSVKELRREFCRRAYHEAAPIMAEFYEKMSENYNGDSAGCFWNDNPVIATKHYIVEKGLADWFRATLEKAHAVETHPGSKKLLQLMKDQLLGNLAKAEKMPKKVELEVKKDWTPVEPLTAIGKADQPGKPDLRIWVKNDNKTLSLRATMHNAEARAIYEKAKQEGRLGRREPEVFDFCHCCELFIDGGLAAAGSYYHLGLNFDGATYTGICSSRMEKPIKWDYTVRAGAAADELELTVVWPLESIGVDISKGNKVGAMFLMDSSAWNGGQWHSPAGFQVLRLNMD